MQQASCLEGGPLLWIWPLYLHVNQKSDDDDDDDEWVEFYRTCTDTSFGQVKQLIIFSRSQEALVCMTVALETIDGFHHTCSVGHLTRKSGVLGSIPGLATYFRFSFRFFKKASCQLLAKVCARSTGSPLRRSKPAQEKSG